MISIITPTFNSGKTIVNNIQSVIGQNYKEFEHIIVDNASTDDTLAKIESIYRENGLFDKVKIISEKDNGISDAFNKGIKASKGEITAILNSDDKYYDNSIFERVIEAFKSEKVLIVHGDINFVDFLHGSNRRRPLPDSATSGILFNHPTMFIKKQLYDEIGVYNTDFRVSMDYEFYCRISKAFTDVDSICDYVREVPIVVMNAGGVSWSSEMKSVDEIKKALILHGYWNFNGRKFYYLRALRTKIKGFISSLNLNFILKIWRNLKWR